MPDLTHEREYGFFSGKVICGVDEVGRGPLAGPVVAAAVILPTTLPDALLHGINDSKKLNTAQREALFEPILQHCHTSIAEASPTEIDTLNILWASMLAMQRAVRGLNTPPDHALIDGNRCPKDLPCPATPIVKGDAKSLSIAAASIIAKVHRDRIMTKLAECHPGYGWERNAGYPTPEHLAALQRLGITEWHRGSFAPVAEVSASRG